MYRVVFTSDYEIHGSGTGSPHELIVEPTDRMLAQLSGYDAKLTIMADVGEILKFKEHADVTGEDRFFYAAIEEQMQRAVRTGHDVQLHLHSSYCNATWDAAERRWRQDWSEYDLASLPYERLRELIHRGKTFLERTLRRVDPDYRCFAFRAANWSMHPSPNIVRALVEEGFCIDTSVWKYGRYDDLVRFDYSGAFSDLLPWPVDEADVCRRDPRGQLFEFPIYTERQPIWVFLTPNRVYRVLAQRLNPLPRVEESPPFTPADPSGRWGPRSLGRRVLGRVGMLFRQHAWKMDFNQCTGRQLIDGLLRVEARYGHLDVPLPFVLIGHSKTFTRHNERTLRPFLEFVRDHPDRFSFGTFKDFDAERYREPPLAA